MKVWRKRPQHNWASHGADSMRYLAVGYSEHTFNWSQPLKRNLKGVV